MAHGTDRPRSLRWICEAAKHGCRHVAMFERRDKTLALLRIVAKPMKQFRKAPLGRVDATAPLDHFELFAARRLGDQRGFSPRAMVAPQIIIAEGFEIFADRNYARSCRVDGQSRNLVAWHLRGSNRLLHGLSKRLHVIRVALRGIVRVVLLPLKRKL